MIALFWITVLYVLPLIVLRHLIRQLAIVRGRKPDGAELYFNIVPLFNVIAIPVVAVEIAERKGGRTFVEVFYGIKKDDYWRKEGAE